MKSASSGTFGVQWFLKMNPDKQDTLIKMSVLTMAAILCKYVYVQAVLKNVMFVVLRFRFFRLVSSYMYIYISLF